MRDAAIFGALSFVAVLALAAAFGPLRPIETTPSPAIANPRITCGMPDPECQKLATEFMARARFANPGRVVASMLVISFSEFTACFTDGSCYGEASGVGKPEPVPNAPDAPDAPEQGP